MVLMKEQAIQVRKQDILRYVLGDSGYHPIEVSLDENYLLDERYEVFDAFIYDSSAKKRLVQGLDYINFIKEVDKLRSMSLSGGPISKREILSMCVELQEIAPTKVLIDDAFDLPEMPVVDREKIKKVFGLDKPRRQPAECKKTQEDHALEEYEEEKKKLFEGLEEEKTICWMGVIPECDKDRARYPTEEERIDMLRQAEAEQEEDEGE